MKKITIGEAAKILGKSKKTLMHWDKIGKFPAEREPISKIRIYDRSVVEKGAKWLDFRRREKDHLRKLDAINRKRSKFIPIAPLNPLTNPIGHNYEEMKQAYKEHDEWEKKYDELQKEDAEFTGWIRNLE